ncbi:MAG: imidazole glycerol phosphate synthase subunit HisH [Oscillatoria sp. SIO1A7]|nr:imidazole glycerol phosphate synthase subunit HisH [Oscillatoria sp. SIO1A7]
MSVIAVIDYDMGNLHSVCKGLENAGARPKITDSPSAIAEADGVVLPGVGSFDPAIQHLRSRDLVEPVKEAIASGKPFLGICLGLQILFESSEEGKEAGLGVIPGVVRRFKSEPDLTIPHMGWNQIAFTQPNLTLWNNIPTEPWAYFVHSYYVDPIDPEVRAATATHGSQTVTAAIARDNLVAVQFHPEKSSEAGLQMLANFVNQLERQKAIA